MHPFWLVEHHGLYGTSRYVDRTAHPWLPTTLGCRQSPLRLTPPRPSLARRGYVVPQASHPVGGGVTQSPTAHAAVGDPWQNRRLRPLTPHGDGMAHLHSPASRCSSY